MDPSFQPLLDVLSTHEFEEWGTVTLDSVSWTDLDVRVGLVVNVDDQPEQRFLITGRRVRSSRVRYHPIQLQIDDDIKVTGEHPVLMPHTAPVTELYFHGRPSSPDTIVGQLVDAHRSLVGDWFGLEDFVKVGLRDSYRALLAGGFGMFASGPQPLIERYARVLADNGVSVSSPPPRPPLWWDGDDFDGQTEGLLALILGRSYFVGAKFTAERQ